MSATDSVQRTLGQFAQAYSSLDADAARRVWPTVNRAALARAFDGLAEQHVSLNDCQIEIAAAAAQANCRGVTEWTAKVGGGRPQTEARTWEFKLTRETAGWQIASAHVKAK